MATLEYLEPGRVLATAARVVREIAHQRPIAPGRDPHGSAQLSAEVRFIGESPAMRDLGDLFPRLRNPCDRGAKPESPELLSDTDAVPPADAASQIHRMDTGAPGDRRDSQPGEHPARIPRIVAATTPAALPDRRCRSSGEGCHEIDEIGIVQLESGDPSAARPHQTKERLRDCGSWVQRHSGSHTDRSTSAPTAPREARVSPSSHRPRRNRRRAPRPRPSPHARGTAYTVRDPTVSETHPLSTILRWSRHAS